MDRGPSSLPLQFVLVLFFKDTDKGKVRFTNIEVVVVKLKLNNLNHPIMVRPTVSNFDLLSYMRGEVKHFLDDRVPLVLCSLFQK